MDDLPNELFFVIFSHFRSYELLALRPVCSRWQQLIDESVLGVKTIVTKHDVGLHCDVSSRLANLLFLFPIFRKIENFHVDYCELGKLLMDRCRGALSSDGLKAENGAYEATIYDTLVDVVKTLKQLMIQDRVPLHAEMIDLINCTGPTAPRTSSPKKKVYYVGPLRTQYEQREQLLNEYLYLDASSVTFPSTAFLLSRDNSTRQRDSSSIQCHLWTPTFGAEDACPSGVAFLWECLPQMKNLKQVTFETIRVAMNGHSQDHSVESPLSQEWTDAFRFLTSLQESSMASKVAFRQVHLCASEKVGVQSQGFTCRVLASLVLQKKDSFSSDLVSSLLQRLHVAASTHDTLADIQRSSPGLKHLQVEPTFNVEINLDSASSAELSRSVTVVRDCLEGKLEFPFLDYLQRLLTSGSRCVPNIYLSIRVTDDVVVDSLSVLNEASVFQHVRQLKVTVEGKYRTRHSGANMAAVWDILLQEGNLQKTETLVMLFNGIHGVQLDLDDQLLPSTDQWSKTPMKYLTSIELRGACFSSATRQHVLSILERATNLRRLSIQPTGVENDAQWNVASSIDALWRTIGRRSLLVFLQIECTKTIQLSRSNWKPITDTTTARLQHRVIDALRGLRQLDSLSLRLPSTTGDEPSEIEEVTLRQVFPRLRRISGPTLSG